MQLVHKTKPIIIGLNKTFSGRFGDVAKVRGINLYNKNLPKLKNAQTKVPSMIVSPQSIDTLEPTASYPEGFSSNFRLGKQHQN